MYSGSARGFEVLLGGPGQGILHPWTSGSLSVKWRGKIGKDDALSQRRGKSREGRVCTGPKGQDQTAKGAVHLGCNVQVEKSSKVTCWQTH